MDQNIIPRNLLSTNSQKRCQKHTLEKGQASSTNGAGKTGYPQAKDWILTPISYPIQKSTQWIKDLNVRSLKVLVENIGKILENTGT
jgi:hypothetical protein